MRGSIRITPMSTEGFWSIIGSVPELQNNVWDLLKVFRSMKQQQRQRIGEDKPKKCYGAT
jgi:hypothetical protein